MNDCYFDKKDWRACKFEVCREQWSCESPVRGCYGRPSACERRQADLYSGARWRRFDNVGSAKETNSVLRAKMQRRQSKLGASFTNDLNSVVDNLLYAIPRHRLEEGTRGPAAALRVAVTRFGVARQNSSSAARCWRLQAQSELALNANNQLYLCIIACP
jgi:hypothetical protein